MLGKPRFISFSPTRLINSIKHEHSCKILYLYPVQSVMYQWIILSALVQYILDGPLHISKCHSLSFPEKIIFLSLKIVFVLANSVDPDEFQNHNLKEKRIHVYLTTPFKIKSENSICHNINIAWNDESSNGRHFGYRDF